MNLQEQQPPPGDAVTLGDLRVQVSPLSTHWIITDEAVLTAQVTNLASDAIELSAELRLPAALVCGARPQVVPAANGAQIVGKDATASVQFAVPAGGWSCGTKGMLSRSSSPVTMSFMQVGPSPEQEITQLHRMEVSWSAPLWVVIAGAVAGIAIIRALWPLAARVGLPVPPSAKAAFWPGVGLDLLAVAVIALLAFVQALPAGFEDYVHAESFGHGLVLGLMSRAAAQFLLAKVTPPGSNEDKGVAAAAPAVIPNGVQQ